LILKSKKVERKTSALYKTVEVKKQRNWGIIDLKYIVWPLISDHYCF